MARDAYEPGPNGDYPAWPRNPDGTTDRERMPTGTRTLTRTDRLGNPIVIDVTPRNPDGTPIVPPGT